MSNAERVSQPPETGPSDGDGGGGSSRPDGSPESWLDRLRAVVGLRPNPSIREDLAEALAAEDLSAGFSPEERAMLANILRLKEVRVDDVMVPRADVHAVEVGTSVGALFARFRESGHSRMPVYRETLDDPVGLVHIKDLMGYITESATVPGGRGGLDLAKVELSRTIADAGLVRNILFVPPSMPVTTLLANMQTSRMQMALVIDEYGGTDGLVSIEDAVEMIVGDIEDEHDDETGPMIVPDGDGAFIADARADLDDVAAAIGSDLAAAAGADDAETLGGLVFGLLGRIPVRGELVSAPGGFEFEVLDADPRRIKKLRIYRRPAGRPDTRRRRASPEAGTAA